MSGEGAILLCVICSGFLTTQFKKAAWGIRAREAAAGGSCDSSTLGPCEEFDWVLRFDSRNPFCRTVPHYLSGETFSTRFHLH